MKAKVHFIGGGNMAQSLIGGLISQGFDASQISVYDPDQHKVNRLQHLYSISAVHDNTEALADNRVDVVLLAVKPHIIPSVLEEIKVALITSQPLLISIAAGITLSTLSKPFADNHPIVRCMPNTPSLVQHGATALCARACVSARQRNLAESILNSVGLTVWVTQEEDLDAVTALSGSGPAYFFYLMEAMVEQAQKMGLDPQTSLDLTIQTAIGAAQLAKISREPPAELRQKVTSPGGTTQAALSVLESNHFHNLVGNAIQAAQERSHELGTETAKRKP